MTVEVQAGGESSSSREVRARRSVSERWSNGTGKDSVRPSAQAGARLVGMVITRRCDV